MNKGELLVISVITLIVVAVWVTSSFIHARNTTIVDPDAKQYLEQVDPNFDKATLDKIHTLATPNPTTSGTPNTSASATPTPRPTTTPRASASASASTNGLSPSR